MKVSMMLLSMFLAGCVSSAQSSTVAELHEKKANVSHKSELVLQQQNKKELVAVLCNAAKYNQAQNIWQQSKLSLVKKSSPTIVTLSWTDQRTAAQVMLALQQYKNVFCATESNAIYTNDTK